MSKKLVRLQEQLEGVIEKQDALVTKATEEAGEDGERRDFSTEEQTDFDQLLKDERDLQDQIAAEKKISDQMKRSVALRGKKPASVIKDDVETLQKSFSYSRFIGSMVRNDKFEGAEAEAHQEGEREARSKGLTTRGQGTLPESFISVGKTAEQRALEVANAAKGGVTVATDVGSMIPILRPNPIMADLGATFMTGLSRPLRLPRKTEKGTAAWRGEKIAATKTTQSFDSISLDPIGLAAWEEYTRELFMESNESIDAMVRDDLSLAIQEKLNETFVNGTGTNEPFGILNYAGIQTIEAGTPDGGALTYPLVTQLPEKIALANADMGRLAFLTNPSVKRAAKNIKLDTGSGKFLWEKGSAILDEYRAVISNHVPGDLAKGSGTDLSPLIFGNWQDFIVAQWGGIDFIVNPYEKDAEAMVKVTVHSWWDMDIRRTASFAMIKDITT